MFVGHYCASVIAKKALPNIPFWLLIIAAQFVDILWAIFIVLGIEKFNIVPHLPSNPFDLYHMPFTHSVAATLFWSVLAFLLIRYSPLKYLTVKESLVVALVVASHWLLDLIVHRPDLHVIYDIKVGLGLWNYPFVAFSIEIGLLVASVYFLSISSAFSASYKKFIAVLCTVLILVQIASSFFIIPKSVAETSGSTLLVFIGLAVLAYYIEPKINQNS